MNKNTMKFLNDRNCTKIIAEVLLDGQNHKVEIDSIHGNDWISISGRQPTHTEFPYQYMIPKVKESLWSRIKNVFDSSPK